MRKELYSIAAFVLLSVPLAAQAPPSAGAGAGLSIWAGATLSTFNPDYGCGKIGASNSSPFSCWNHILVGVGPYVDTSFFLLGKIGFEGVARLGLWNGPSSLNQYSYLGGPRFRIFHYRNLQFNGKFLLGRAHMDLPAPLPGGKPILPQSGGYFAYAPGVAAEFPLSTNVAARVEYEYQRWPGWPSFVGHSVGGLTPNGFAYGVSYRIPSPHSGMGGTH